MDFRIGQSVKPSSINNQHQVLFEEYNTATPPVLIPVAATEPSCIAYGFNWDIEKSICFLMPHSLDFVIKESTKFNSNLLVGGNSATRISGAVPFIGSRVENNIIGGTRNLALGSNENNINFGDNNTLGRNVSNSIITGTKVDATVSNCTVLGGNNPDTDIKGERQITTLIFGAYTTTNATVPSYLNNTTGSYFPIPEGTAMYFHSEILAIRVGGEGEGSTGDFASWLERGVIVNPGGGKALVIKRQRKSMNSNGIVGNWRPTAAITGSSFVMNVRGEANTNIEWVSSIRFTQIKTGIAW